MFEIFDLTTLITTVGYAGIAAIVFAESGLLVGFFLPGDSLLFAAGFLASQGFLNLWLLIPIIAVSAIVGDSVGYWIGKKAGPRIFTREDSWWFSKKRIEDAQAFFEKHGAISIVLARFIPFVRTFVPTIAGVGMMHYPTFLFYNVAGGILWAVSVPLLGYFLGSVIPGIDQYILPIILLIIVSTCAPVLWRLLLKKPKAE